MELVLVAVLVVVVVGFIAYPLFTAPRDEALPTNNRLDALIAQRDSTYDALRDLDFDFQLGKLSQRDYQTLRERYKTRAALVLQQIDATRGNGKEAHALLDAQIEAQVANLRALPRRDDEVEREVARLRTAKRAKVTSRCRNCGAPYRPGDQFCANCGNKL